MDLRVRLQPAEHTRWQVDHRLDLATLKLGQPAIEVRDGRVVNRADNRLRTPVVPVDCERRVVTSAPADERVGTVGYRCVEERGALCKPGLRHDHEFWLRQDGW